MSPDPRVAVVIITRNRRELLMKTLGKMSALPEKPLLVVVNNGSSDDTSRQVKQHFPEVDLIDLEENLGAAGRTLGVQRVRQPYVAFCDDDCWWEPGSLGRAADLLDQHPTLGLVSGRVLIGPEEREDLTCLRMENSPLTPVPGLPGSPILGFLAAASMVRAQAFLDVGGFERRLLLGCEEILLGLDLATAGWNMAYIKNIVVHHHPCRERDVRERRRLHDRNVLWVAWLRRPAARALARTFSALAYNFFDVSFLSAFIEAASGLPWVLRHRRVIPPHIDTALQQIEK